MKTKLYEIVVHLYQYQDNVWWWEDEVVAVCNNKYEASNMYWKAKDKNENNKNTEVIIRQRFMNEYGKAIDISIDSLYTDIDVELEDGVGYALIKDGKIIDKGRYISKEVFELLKKDSKLISISEDDVYTFTKDEYTIGIRKHELIMSNLI